MVGPLLYGDRDDDGTAFVVRTVMAPTGGRTVTDRVEVGNLPAAGSGGVAVGVDVFVDEVVAAAVAIARMTGPSRARTQCIRLDFPVGHYRRVLYRGKPAPRSRRLSAHRRDHDL